MEHNSVSIGDRRQVCLRWSAERGCLLYHIWYSDVPRYAHTVGRPGREWASAWRLLRALQGPSLASSVHDSSCIIIVLVRLSVPLPCLSYTPPFPETPLNVWRGRAFHPRTCKLEKLNMYQHQSVMLVYHTFARSH